MASRSASRPSRSMVARTCSEPGVMRSWVLAVRPLAEAWRAMEAARVMSSYDELVHDPMSADEISTGTPFSARPGADLADLVGQVGRVGAVDERLQLVEVDLDQAVVVRRRRRAAGARPPRRRRRRWPRDRWPSGRRPCSRRRRTARWWRRSRRPCCRWWPCRWRRWCRRRDRSTRRWRRCRRSR